MFHCQHEFRQQVPTGSDTIVTPRIRFLHDSHHCLPGTGILAGNLVDADEEMFEEIETEARHKVISRGASRQGRGYSGVRALLFRTSCACNPPACE